METPSPILELHIPPDVWQAIAGRLSLSPREIEIAQLVCRDVTECEIGSTLQISRHTVHSHLERAYRKVGANSRAGLVSRVFAAYVSTR